MKYSLNWIDFTVSLSLIFIHTWLCKLFARIIWAFGIEGVSLTHINYKHILWKQFVVIHSLKLLETTKKHSTFVEMISPLQRSYIEWVFARNVKQSVILIVVFALLYKMIQVTTLSLPLFKVHMEHWHSNFIEPYSME